MSNTNYEHVSTFLHALFRAYYDRIDFVPTGKAIESAQAFYDVMEFQTTELPTIHWEGAHGSCKSFNGWSIDIEIKPDNAQLLEMYSDIIHMGLDIAYIRDYDSDFKQFGFADRTLIVNELMVKSLMHTHPLAGSKARRHYRRLAERLNELPMRFLIGEIVTGEYHGLDEYLVTGFLQTLSLPVRG